MDREITYAGAIPQVEDLAYAQRFSMVGLGYLAQMTLGVGTVVDGLAVMPTPGSPMSVTVAPGSIATMAVIDQTSFSTLAANLNPVLKLGINTTATTFALTAPATPGQSINYLIEAAFSESDVQPVVIPYYNAANPAQPLNGAAGSGASQPTRRQQIVSLQLKAGAPAAAGAQATPACDVGWVGIAIVTLNAGATSVLQTNILPFPGAPFLASKLPTLRQRLTGPLTLFVSNQGNDGWTGTQFDPFLTLGGALNALASRYDLAGNTVTLSMQPGTYTGCTIPGYLYAGQIAIVGSPANPALTVVNAVNGAAIHALAGARVSVSGVTLSASGGSGDYQSGGFGVLAETSSSITLGSGIAFASCSTAHIYSLTGASVGLAGAGQSYSITGSAGAHILANSGGSASIADAIITLSGSPSFSNAFASSGSGATVSVWGCTFSGGATGMRFAASLNGTINSEGAGANYLPGSTAGATASGGQYV